MLQLTDRQWKPFAMKSIFEIDSGRDIYEAERVNGSTPYISSSAMNNGIAHFVSNTNKSLEANCISINRNGSVGFCFYHPYSALYSNDCRKLRLRRHRNRHVSLFMTHVIMMQKDKYNYSVKMGTGRLMRQNIMLPVDAHGEPDYAFMEAYIRERENALLTRYSAFVKSRTIPHRGGGKTSSQGPLEAI